MTNTVSYKYALGDQVSVIAIGMTGRIDSLVTDKDGSMYRVVYWNEGERYSIHMYDWEIEDYRTTIGGEKRK